MTLESAIAGFIAGTLTEEVIRRGLNETEFKEFSSVAGLLGGIAAGSIVEDLVESTSIVTDIFDIFD